MSRSDNDGRQYVVTDPDHPLKVDGSFSAEPPVGGATEAEQQAQTALLGAGLPDALTEAGNLKVAVLEQSGGGLTDEELRATPVPVSGPLTDDELRASDVKVSLDGESVAVTGPLTDTELRAADVKVTLDSEAVVLGAGTAAVGKLTALPGLDIPSHDYIALSYTGSDLTGVTYKSGGSGGTTVATLTLAYTNGVLTSVAKS